MTYANPADKVIVMTPEALGAYATYVQSNTHDAAQEFLTAHKLVPPIQQFAKQHNLPKDMPEAELVKAFEKFNN